MNILTINYSKDYLINNICNKIIAIINYYNKIYNNKYKKYQNLILYIQQYQNIPDNLCIYNDMNDLILIIIDNTYIENLGLELYNCLNHIYKHKAGRSFLYNFYLVLN